MWAVGLPTPFIIPSMWGMSGSCSCCGMRSCTCRGGLCVASALP